MAHPLRWFIPNLVYEFTTRTIQERFLLRPSEQSRDLILGVLGRAQALYPCVLLYAFVFMSNHVHMMVSSSDADQLVHFMGYVNSNVARELGRLHGWKGPFWGRRTRPIPILDDDALISRLRYLMSHGVKEGLVATPAAWPGASAVPALIGQGRLLGTWIHRDFEARARRRVNPPSPDTYTLRYEVVLTPIPPWQRLTRAEQIERYRALAADIEREHAGTRKLGVEEVLRVHPQDQPEPSERRPAPLCHSSDPDLRAQFRAAYRAFVDAFRAATRHARDALAETWTAVWPRGSFPRPNIPLALPRPLADYLRAGPPTAAPS